MYMLEKLPTTMISNGIFISCDIIVHAKYRNQGYGTEGIQLLCMEAKKNGIFVLHDDIAADNPSYKLFLKNGFEIEYKINDVVMVKRNL